MLKCNIDRLRNKCKVASKGQFRIIMTEVLGLIATIYEGLKETSPDAADEFKRTIQAAMIDPKSPVFKCKYFE